MLELRYSVASDGKSPFEAWFYDLSASAAARVAAARARLRQGNLSNVKGGRDGEVLVILPTGGTKQRQQRDIEAAKPHWAD